MAQTNFTPILLYASSTPTNVPLAANLTNSATGSELAINIADKNLFFKDNGGVVNTVPIRQSSTSSNGWLSSTDWNTFNSKAPATSGTSILYGNGSGGFSNVTIGSGISFAGGTLSATGSGGTVTSVTGTAPVVSSGGTTPAISMPAATTSVSGYLTSTDWNTFNSKQPAGTYVTSVGATSPVTSSGGTTPTIAMPAATTSVSGYLTSTDWNTFNNKGSGTVTSVTGTAPVVSSGGATPAISMAAATGSVNGYLTSTDWTTFNNKGSGTVTSVAALTLGTTGTDLSSTVATGTTTPVITLNVPTASATNRGALSAADWTTFNNKGNGTVTSVTGTAPVVSSGGATPAISMAAATTSVNGYLTSTDWTTFNGKQAALVSGTNIKTVNGTSLLGSGDVGTIGVAYGGTGLTSLTAKYIPFGNGTSAFGSSANFVWDNTNGRLGVGFSSPTAQIEIAGYPNATLKLSDGGSGSYTFSRQAGDGYFHSVDDSGFYGFIWASGSNEIMRTFASSGVSIGNTTDPGVGSLYVTNKVIGGTGFFNTTSNLGFPTVFDALAASGSNGAFTFKNSAGNNQWLGWMWNNAAGATSNNLFIAFGTDSSYTNRGSITYNSTAGLLSFNTTSDQRLKTNIVDAPSALDKINAVRVRSFDWIETGNHNDFGVIAQELIEVAPEAVTVGDNAKEGQVEKPWAVDTSALNPAMIKAIQELTAKVTALEEQVLNLSVK